MHDMTLISLPFVSASSAATLSISVIVGKLHTAAISPRATPAPTSHLAITLAIEIDGEAAPETGRRGSIASVTFLRRS
ncbi:MAG: hypothetical protein M1838_004321 [Thelocarpon superellum]|nr:MAG: hypothetical protein M1838_004321 [Thelocarpon superellum]